MLLLKETKAGGFSVKSMCKLLDQSRLVVFPHLSIWNPYVPSKVGFFCLGSWLEQGIDFGSAKMEGKSTS